MAEIELKRKQYEKLLGWKKIVKKTDALMVLGARQVGKTYLIRAFGKREYKSFIQINFIKQGSLKSIFEADLEPDEIYKRMTANIDGIQIIPHQTLVFLDEIQVCGGARTALKFLAEDGRCDIIASGSLLGLAYGEDDDPEVEVPPSNPTGYEDFLTLYPLDFEEFLWANGISEEQITLLKEHLQSLAPIPMETREKYEELFREYMVIGGMPEVVANYVENKNFSEVDRIQRRINTDYRFDIAKHAKGAEKTKVRSCYDAIPRQLAKELKKFQYSTVEKNQTSKKYGGSAKWLIDSCLVNPCYRVSDPSLPLLGHSDDSQFKLYFHDTGLLMAEYGFETKRALLSKKLSGDVKGGIYENAVAQILMAKGHKLYYYRPSETQEIEFLIEADGEVVPIEVKSSNSSTTSLNAYIQDKKPSIAYKFIDGGIGKVDCKLTLPHFLAALL